MDEVFHVALLRFKTGEVGRLEMPDGRFTPFIKYRRNKGFELFELLPPNREPGYWYFSRSTESRLINGVYSHYYDEI